MNDVITTIDDKSTVNFWTDVYRVGALRGTCHAVLVGLVGEYVGLWSKEAFFNLVGDTVGFSQKSKTVTIGADAEPVVVTYYEPQPSTLSPMTTVFEGIAFLLSSDNLKTNAQVRDSIDGIANRMFDSVRVSWSNLRLVAQSTAFTRDIGANPLDGHVDSEYFVSRMNEILREMASTSYKNDFGNSQTAHILGAIQSTGGELDKDESTQVKKAQKLSSDNGEPKTPDAQVHKAGDTILRALSGDIKITGQAGFDKLVGDLADAIETYQINQNVSESMDTLVE
jgi:hypothetical protein